MTDYREQGNDGYRRRRPQTGIDRDARTNADARSRSRYADDYDRRSRSYDGYAEGEARSRRQAYGRTEDDARASRYDGMRRERDGSERSRQPQRRYDDRRYREGEARRGDDTRRDASAYRGRQADGRRSQADRYPTRDADRYAMRDVDRYPMRDVDRYSMRNADRNRRPYEGSDRGDAHRPLDDDRRRRRYDDERQDRGSNRRADDGDMPRKRPSIRQDGTGRRQEAETADERRSRRSLAGDAPVRPTARRRAAEDRLDEERTADELDSKQEPSPAKRDDQPKASASAEPPATTEEAEQYLEPSKRSFLSSTREITISAFNVIMAAGLVLGVLLFMRPNVSQVENRQLTEFPAFTFQTFIDGDFTEGVSTWYADTFPFRDKLVTLNQRIKSLYGFESETQMYGTAVEGDEIPTEGEATVEEAPKKEPVEPEAYNSWNLEEDIQGQIMQGLYVKDGAVYATYGFTQEAANDYVNAVNNAAEKLDGTTNVYSILIPNNSGVLLDETELAALGGSDQGQAIQYYYDSYNDKVTPIETMNTLLEHKDEYLFFRTDHHWTALASYYIYLNFCEAKGIEPHIISSFEEQDFTPFLGSYYQQLQLESLAANPDTVQAWIPKGTNELVYTDVDGSTVDWKVIQDVSEWDDGTKYNCFVGGDEPWAEIHNPEITDGSSVVIVKESYGNCFVPWLVDHYEYVYIADFRYTTVNVADFCAEHQVTDLILLNNISIIGSVEVAGKIASIL